MKGEESYVDRSLIRDFLFGETRPSPIQENLRSGSAVALNFKLMMCVSNKIVFSLLLLQLTNLPCLVLSCSCVPIFRENSICFVLVREVPTPQSSSTYYHNHYLCLSVCGLFEALFCLSSSALIYVALILSVVCFAVVLCVSSGGDLPACLVSL